MSTWKNITAVALAIAVAGSSAIAQSADKVKTKKEKNQEIIIRKSGDTKEKMTIVVDGDKVTINGKPVDEYKGNGITITSRDGIGAFAPGARAFAMPRGGARSFNDMESWAPARGNKAFLGVVTEKTEGGVKINDVTDESAAEKAGLKEDDVITTVDGKAIATPADLVAALADKKPADKVDITYKRDGKESKTSATLSENKNRTMVFNGDDFNFNLPPEAAPYLEGIGMMRKPKIGMQIQDVEEGSGVQVKEVDDDTPASKAGFKEGDVITQVNGKAVAGVLELREAIKDVKEGESFKVTYRRGSKTDTAEVKLPKRLRTANL